MPAGNALAARQGLATGVLKRWNQVLSIARVVQRGMLLNNQRAPDGMLTTDTEFPVVCPLQV